MSAGTVLLVDDEPELLEIAALRFEEEGFKTFTAGSVKEALKVLGENKIDAVVSDVKMPGGKGLEILDFAKTALHPFHLFFVSGSIELPLEEMLTGGAKGVFRKPIDYQIIIDVVKTTLKTSEFANQRKHFRAEVELKVKVTIGDKGSPISLPLKNIGQGGFFAEVPMNQFPPKDTPLGFEILFLGEHDEIHRIRGTGHSVWEKKAPGQPQGFGFQFLKFDKDSHHSLLVLVNSLVTKAFIPRG